MRPLDIHWCIPHCCLTKFTPPTHEREVDWIICPVTKKLKLAYWILCLSNPIPFNSQLILSSYNWVYDFTYFGWSAALQITLCHSLVHPHCCLTKFTSPPPWGGSRFDTRHYAVYEEARASRGCIMILEMFVQSDSQLNSVDNKTLSIRLYMLWLERSIANNSLSFTGPRCCLTKFTSPPLPWGGSRFDTRHYAV